MTIFRFLFHFLYTRNWHTGQLELSRPRVVLFTGMIALIVIGIVAALFLQAPVTYTIPQ